MRNLFKADIRRILKMPIIYISVVISVLYIIIALARDLATQGMNATVYISGITRSFESPIFAILVTVPIFYAVFSNELSSKSMQCVLGRGLSRDKLIITKLLDAAVLLMIMYLIFTIITGVFADASLGISDRQMFNLILFIWMRGLRYFGYIVFSAMIMYLSESAAAGMVSMVAFTLVFKVIFAIIEALFDVKVYDYTFDGLLDWAYTSIETGAFAWQFIPAFCYIALAIAITIIFFRRKEFEF